MADLADLVMSANTAMVVVTAADGRGARAGCLVGFHAQCSIDPPRYAVWLSKANRTYRVAMLSQHLAVHFLGAGDRDLAELFGGQTGDEVDKFAHCDHEPGPDGVPLLVGCPHRMVARRAVVWESAEDHACLVLEPVQVWGGSPFQPLRFHDVRDIDAGHAADDVL